MTTHAFSDLPYHMVRLVAQYVCQAKSELDIDDNGKVPANPLVTLLHICHNWRQVTLPLMFGSGSIFISEQHEPNNIYARYHVSILKYIDQSYNAYMLQLTIDIDLYEATHGKTLSLLSASHIGNFVFPSLRHITISIRNGQETQIECCNATSNIRKLAQLINRMLPTLESITVRYTCIFISMSICVNTQQYTNNLVDELSDKLSVIYLKNNALLGGRTECSLLITGLTLLKISWNDNYSTLSNVIYANSQSLQKLYITYNVYDGIEELVHRQGLKQKYMCYPQLTSLYLTGLEFTPENIIPPTGNAVVFPRLCIVDIFFEYPFSDDVLFRGNRWTLKSIDIALNTQAMMQLSLDGVFHKGNMLALEDIVIRSDDAATRDAALNSCSKNFFQGLLSSSHYLALQSQPYYDILIGSIDCKTQYQKLICLHLGSSNVTFENIEVLLQALPRLSYLKSTISSLGNKYLGMTLPKLLKSMQSTFNPLSKSFCTWSIHSLDIELLDLVTTCIMLLIDQCPNFQTVVFNKIKYTTAVKIHQQLMRVSPRMSRLYARKNEKIEFKISFTTRKALLQIIHNSL